MCTCTTSFAPRHIRANSFRKDLKYERRKLQQTYKTGNEANLVVISIATSPPHCTLVSF